MSEQKRNTSWLLEIQSPLLRPGVKLTVGPVSEKYIVEEARKAMEVVREINRPKGTTQENLTDSK